MISAEICAGIGEITRSEIIAQLTRLKRKRQMKAWTILRQEISRSNLLA
jgi:Na+-transporting NADH:ubiquinone oxidoreductase subunit NqrF